MFFFVRVLAAAEMRVVLQPSGNESVEQVEDEVVNKYREVMTQYAGDPVRQNRLRDRLSAVDVDLDQLAIQHGKSLRIIIIRSSVQQLELLREHYNSGVFKDVLEAVFILLSGRDVRISSVEWKEEQFEKCRRQLMCKYQVGYRLYTCTAPMTLSSIPLACISDNFTQKVFHGNVYY